jgi:hypothetical protein
MQFEALLSSGQGKDIVSQLLYNLPHGELLPPPGRDAVLAITGSGQLAGACFPVAALYPLVYYTQVHPVEI